MNCKEEIPCNPCETACHFGAIQIGTEITSKPTVDLDLCSGCAICLAVCPGLAIRMVDQEYSEYKSLVGVVHEIYPLPDLEDEVSVIDSSGMVLGTGMVKRFRKPLKNDPTTIVILEVDKEISTLVHGIEHNKFQSNRSDFNGSIESNTVICRCEEVYKKEILEAIAKGDSTVDAIKRRTRAGMGLCQGNTCNQLVSSLLKQAGKSNGEISSKRTPVNAITIQELAEIEL